MLCYIVYLYLFCDHRFTVAGFVYPWFIEVVILRYFTLKVKSMQMWDKNLIQMMYIMSLKLSLNSTLISSKLITSKKGA